VKKRYEGSLFKEQKKKKKLEKKKNASP